MITAHEEITKVRLALARHEAKLQRMLDVWLDRNAICCPSCYWGDNYRRAYDQSRRTAAWLVILLRKRNWPGDAEEALRLEKEHCLEWSTNKKDTASNASPIAPTASTLRSVDPASATTVLVSP